MILLYTCNRCNMETFGTSFQQVPLLLHESFKTGFNSLRTKMQSINGCGLVGGGGGVHTQGKYGLNLGWALVTSSTL